VETMELEAQVYTGITGDSDLMAMLPNGIKSVFHLQAPSDDNLRYPILVYSPVSDVPALVGDDIEVTHRVTMRVHIITTDGQYHAIYRRIHQIMQGLGYARVQAMPYVENDQRVLIVDYRIGVDSEWQQ